MLFLGMQLLDAKLAQLSKEGDGWDVVTKVSMFRDLK